MGRQTLTYLDTNVTVFLYDGNLGRMSSPAIKELEKGASGFLVSGMVLLELEMLYERRRLRYSAAEIIKTLSLQIGLKVCQLPMAVIMQSALEIKWTREPGDRIIVANAIANNQARLITSDRSIRAKYRNAIW